MAWSVALDLMNLMRYFRWGGRQTWIHRHAAVSKDSRLVSDTVGLTGGTIWQQRLAMDSALRILYRTH
jgi:hypothetical protein